jgi:hypothetical protein
LIRIFTLLATLVYFTNANSQYNSEYGVTEKGTVEIISGVNTQENKIAFWVSSNGCTNKESFKVLNRILNEEEVEITLIRVKRDFCKGLTRIIKIFYYPEELGIENLDTKIILANPISVITIWMPGE